MPPISRITDKTSTGHICVPVTYLSVVKQTSVFAQFLPIARVGDLTVSHPFPPKPPCAPHVAAVNKGVNSVLTVFIPTATIGKSCDLGALITGAKTVWAGGFASASKAGGGGLDDVGAGSKYDGGGDMGPSEF